jgi:tripartite-type tricarboxylate transporter receptor subunit TctC
MLKKLFISFVAAMSLSAFAKPTVSIYWPFGFGSNNATAIRNTAQCMNQIQNDYNFILENKQGAGGTVAVRHVAASQELAILSISSSYFMRPSFFPDASYDVNSLKPAAILATGQPLLLMSGKYKTLDELKAQPKLSIGIDAGTVRQLVGEEIKRALPNSDVVLVPHPDSGKSTIDTMTGVLDANVGFIFNAERFKGDERFNALAITGRVNQGPYKTFASQKWPGFEDITMDYWFFVPANTPEADTKKINLAVQECNRKKAAADSWAIDGLSSNPIDFETTNRIFQQQIKFWPALKVKLIGK